MPDIDQVLVSLSSRWAAFLKDAERDSGGVCVDLDAGRVVPRPL